MKIKDAFFIHTDMSKPAFPIGNPDDDAQFCYVYYVDDKPVRFMKKLKILKSFWGFMNDVFKRRGM